MKKTRHSWPSGALGPLWMPKSYKWCGYRATENILLRVKPIWQHQLDKELGVWWSCISYP